MNIIIKIKTTLSSNIFKVFSFNVGSTLVKLLTGFVSIKVVSMIIGPAGIALLGQLNNFTLIVLTFSTGGINSGVTKYISEYGYSNNVKRLFIGTSFKVILFYSTICSISLLVGSKFLSIAIFNDVKYYSIFLVFGLTIFFYSFNNLLIAIINGYKEYKTYVLVNIATSITGLVFSVVLATTWGLYGALLSVVTFQSFVLFVTLFFLRKFSWYNPSIFFTRFSKVITLKLSKYSIMSLVSISTVPISQMIVRNYLINNTTIQLAGLWEGLNRISNLYLMVLTLSLSVYYLPRLSEIKSEWELKKEIIKMYKLFIPIIIFISVSIFIFKDLIIYILFTKEFYGMRNLFLFQLIGDFLKICSWILAYQFIAKAMVKTFVLLEILLSCSFILISIYSINHYGVIGVTIGYAINYLLYFLVVIFIFRKMLFGVDR